MSQTPVPGITRRPRPVERFLGPEEASGGPFALLGLSPTVITDELILSALDRQIERVARHPECDTPEADEVRLALHAAAAQLLDPVVRRHLVAKWTGATPPPPSAPRAPTAAPAPAVRRAAPEKLLEADAVLALALFGGWNQRSMRRLLAVASRRGMGPRQVAATLRGLANRRRPPRSAASRAALPMRRARTRDQLQGADAAGPLPLPSHAPAVPPNPLAVVRPRPIAAEPRERVAPSGYESPEEASRQTLRTALTIGGIGFAFLAAIIFAIIALTSSSPPKPTTPGGPTAKGPAPAVGAPPSTTAAAPAPPQSPYAPVIPAPESTQAASAEHHAPTPPPASDTTDPAVLARELIACAQGVGSEPNEATTRFQAAVQHLAESWPHIPRDRLISCHDAIIEFLYKSADAPDITLRALDAVASGSAVLSAGVPPTAAQIAPAAWSTGMLVRLGRERDLSAAAKSALESRLSLALGPSRPTMDQSFDAGLNAALSILPQRLTPTRAGPADVDLAAWQQWGACVDAFTASDAAARTRLLLSGLETLMIQGPEPDADKGIADAIAELVTRLTWRPNDESRRWLIRWFDDRRISSADLHALTSALATRSSAEGVDLTMVLSTSASEKSRADLRARYATVWSMEQAVNRDAITSAWTQAAHDAVTASLNAGDEADELADAAVLARMSEAAWWQWRGEGAEANHILDDPRGPIDIATSAPTPPPSKSMAGQTDGGWAEKYLAALQKTKAKRDLLDQVANQNTELGPVDAEVIAHEAILGGVAELRTPAQEIVKNQADNPPMINAILELLPRIPRTPQNSVLIETVTQSQLPPVKDAAWPIAARRVLVERLLEAIATESPRAKIDRLARILATSYRAMASPTPLTAEQRKQPRQPAAAASAAQLWLKWRGQADALVPTTPPPLPLDQLDRRRSGRIGQAKGLVQTFSAEQTSLCEIMAYVVNAEQPARADQIKQVLERLAEDRRHAPTILRQINATERAILQLWLIRYQEDPA